jgi:hypothetical protein
MTWTPTIEVDETTGEQYLQFPQEALEGLGCVLAQSPIGYVSEAHGGVAWKDNRPPYGAMVYIRQPTHGVDT